MKTYNTYSDKSKRSAVLKLKREGGSVTSIARKLGIPPSTFKRWVVKYEQKHGVRIRGVKN